MEWYLPVIWAALIGTAVAMYVILDGFDLGLGILFPTAANDRERDQMMASIKPFWDGNETWLVLGGAGLLAAFPLAYSVVLSGLYLPLVFMLTGLVFRGVAFEFRLKSQRRRYLWDHAFFWGSLFATFAQGVVLGSFVRGFEVRDNQFAGSIYDWLSPFPLAVGAGLVFGYILLGATWLVMKTEGELQQWARKWSRIGLAGVVAFIAMVSIWTPLFDERIAQRWFSFPNMVYLAPMPIVTGLLALWLWRALRTGREAGPFFAAMGLFLLCFLGLAVSLWPHIVPPSITLWDAAASPKSQAFLLIGTLFLLPIIVGYTGWSYYVFRGKVRADAGYH